MSFEAMTWALEQPVGGNDKLVLLLIANRIHKDQGFCWPKIRTIAEEAGISYSTVQRCINSLVDRGFMTVQRTHAQDGSLGGYRFYMANDKISPGWENFRHEDKPSGQNDQSSPTGQNDRTHRSNCYLGTGQNDRTKPIRLTSKRTSKNNPLNPPAAENQMVKKAETEIIQPDSFDAFWAAYPRKVSKGHARKAWAAAIRKTSAVEIIRAVAEARWPREPKFIPHPATWLNGERWNDRDIGARSVSEIIRERAGSFIPAPLPEWGTVQ